MLASRRDRQLGAKGSDDERVLYAHLIGDRAREAVDGVADLLSFRVPVPGEVGAQTPA